MPLRKKYASKSASRYGPLTYDANLGLIPSYIVPTGGDYLKLFNVKEMITYKHKPTNSLWDAYWVGGKEVYINRTDAWAVASEKENITMIPKGIVTTGNDWELMWPEPTIEDLNKPLFSYNDILNLADQNGHYRQFQTQHLKDLLKSKLNNVH